MMQFRRVGKAKRAHQSRGLVGTARKGAPLPTLQDIVRGRRWQARIGPVRLAVVAEDIRAYAWVK